MHRYYSLIIIYFFVGCSTDKMSEEISLSSLLSSKDIVLDNVISCAASNKNDKLISVYLFPREGATNIQYFETINDKVDKNNYDNYNFYEFPLSDVFNGYLKKFEVPSSNDKWVIVSFEEDGKTHLSNPIHLKQQTKPTEHLQQSVMVDASTDMPFFSWQDGLYDDTKIYFQVVSDTQNNLFSGTYTFDKMFTYYKLDNVVLNITKNTPPVLSGANFYEFTLMGVSEDNWVNQFSITAFELE
ncbi:MAG: hypothetical protein HKN53_09555 [Maribacter sp.]|nr:hypothetical protein [Maribacter sp.]